MNPRISEEAREAANKLNNRLVDKDITLGQIDRIIQLAIDQSTAKLTEENKGLRNLLTRINTQLECPGRNTTMTSYRRDGSVIISGDIRDEIKQALRSEIAKLKGEG